MAALDRFGLIAAGIALAAAASPVCRAQDIGAEAEVGAPLEPSATEPFARLRFLDPSGSESAGASALRADGYREEVFFNSPLFRGDRLETESGQRAELQLPDGALVRLDRDGGLELVALRDPSGRFSASTLLALHRGRIQVDLPEAGAERDAFRVDTFACSVYPLERSSFRVDLLPGRVAVSVGAGAVEVAGDQGSVVVDAGYRTTIAEGGRPDGPSPFNVLVGDPFDRWVDARDDVYALRAPPGREYEALPDEVRPYYGELSRSGRWVWVEEYGYVWAPVVAAGWRPYYDGYWAYGGYGPVWVSYESWGWATYRYGRWSCHTGLGWVWIPGRIWSGAWVAWHYGPSYVGWCPLGYWGYPAYVSFGFHFGHPYYDHHPWVFVHHGHHYYHHVDNVVVRHKQDLARDLDDGVVVRRAVRTERGAVRSDVVRRVRDDRAAFDPIEHDRGGEDRNVRAVRRSFRDTEREVLSRGDSMARRAAPRRPAADDRSAVARAPVRRRATDGAGTPGSSGSGGSPVRSRSGEGAPPTRSARPPAPRERSAESGGVRPRDPERAAPPRARPRAATPAPPRATSTGTPTRRAAQDDRPEARRRPAAEESTIQRSTPRERPRSTDATSRERVHTLLREANRGGSSPRQHGRAAPAPRTATPDPPRARPAPGSPGARAQGSPPPRREGNGASRSGSAPSQPRGTAPERGRSGGKDSGSRHGSRGQGGKSGTNGRRG